MLTLFVLVPLVLMAIVVSIIARVILLPFHHRRYGGAGYRRRRGLGGSLLSILALVALDRLFPSRRF